jgi:hypothetical protein
MITKIGDGKVPIGPRPGCHFDCILLHERNFEKFFGMLQPSGGNIKRPILIA